MAHKKNRRMPIGEHATLYFEDRLTVQYQIQEMLRIERIFEAAGIEDELRAYNPLIPDGSNLKATFMLEYEAVEQRRAALARLIGIERKIWIMVGCFDPVHPIANEDLERETEEKTSAVHFLRFEFNTEMITAAQAGQPISIGIDHPEYDHRIDRIPENIRQALVKDFD